MQVHKHIDRLPDFRNAVVTIGTFDGVHNGHRIITKQLTEKAAAINGESIIITFNPHPRRIVGNQHSELRLINTIAEKIELLEKQGIDHLVIVPFTSEFAEQTALEYVEQFLVAHFHPRCIVIGYDHRFGKNREGNYQLLEALKSKHGYELMEIPAEVLNDNTISSTRIRTSVINSHIAAANSYLGYAYFFEGTVVEGNKLGRTIGYPTANIRMNDTEKLMPGNGVYAVRVKRMNQNGTWMKGMMNIGVRPTVDGTRQTVEVNIFDFDADIYGETLRIEVICHLRGEQKFSGLDSLKAQLQKDKDASQLLLQAYES